MVMVADSVPGLKRWVGTLGLKDSAKLLVIRVVVAFLLHAGRMSCLRAAGAVRCEARHRAQISRFLARPRWRKLDINSILRQQLLELEVRGRACSCSSSTPRWSVRQARKRKTPTARATVSGGRAKGVATARTSTLARTATASRWAS